MSSNANAGKSFGPQNRPKKKLPLVDLDLNKIGKALAKLKGSDAPALSDLETYFEWYRNVFGEVALELLLDDCRDALRERDYEELLNVINQVLALHSNHKKQAIAEPTFQKVPFKAERRLGIAAMAGIQSISEMTIESAEYTKQETRTFGEIAAVVSAWEIRLAELVAAGDITQEEAAALVEDIRNIEIDKFAQLTLEEYKNILTMAKRMDYRDIEEAVFMLDTAVVRTSDHTERMMGEEGFTTFAEVSTLFKEVNEKLNELVESGDITISQAVDVAMKLADSRVSDLREIAKGAERILELESGKQSQMAISLIVDDFAKSMEEDIADRSRSEAGFIEVGKNPDQQRGPRIPSNEEASFSVDDNAAQGQSQARSRFGGEEGFTEIGTDAERERRRPVQTFADTTHFVSNDEVVQARAIEQRRLQQQAQQNQQAQQAHDQAVAAQQAAQIAVQRVASQARQDQRDAAARAQVQQEQPDVPARTDDFRKSAEQARQNQEAAARAEQQHAQSERQAEAQRVAEQARADQRQALVAERAAYFEALRQLQKDQAEQNPTLLVTDQEVNEAPPIDDRYPDPNEPKEQDWKSICDKCPLKAMCNGDGCGPKGEKNGPEVLLTVGPRPAPTSGHETAVGLGGIGRRVAPAPAAAATSVSIS